MEHPYLKLQNGSDVRGVALATADGPPVNLPPEAVAAIIGSFVSWLAARSGKAASALRIGVGHDSRLTARPLAEAALAALGAAGATGLDCGLASTPAMFMGCLFPETAFDGAVMITASHLPQNRNGLKFFTREGGAEKGDVTAILTGADAGAAMPAAAQAQGCGLMELYAAFLRQKMVAAAGGEKPLAGLRVVVDAGNGAGGFFVSQVLEPLGANCAGSQFLQPDGSFPNHIPNPENPEAMASICRAVQAANADLGLIFDTDVDRASAVFAGGAPANRDTIIALMAAILAPEYPGGAIVTDSITSERLTDYLENTLAMKHHRFRRGYRNVINEAVRLNAEGTECPMAIETSGHCALKENYFLDDGAYMAVRIVTAAAKAKAAGGTLRELLRGYREPQHTTERRMTIDQPDFAAYGRQVLEAFGARAEQRGYRLPHSYEGVRISKPGTGWALLRMSLHDPVMPLNVEGETAGDLAAILRDIRAMLAGFDKLDLGVLDG